MNALKLSVAALAASVAFAGAAIARDQIQIAGSSTVLPYASIVAEAFGENTDFGTPVVESGGSGAGRKKLCEGVGENTIDIANSSSRISKSDIELCTANGVTDMFGIMGSAFMDAMDIFAPAGIRLIPVVHEQGAAHMADGYARVSGRHGVVIGQNGPGISNCVTAIAAAYWAHSPVVMITPETGTMGMGLGGFQEANQLPMFQEFTKYQGHVNNPKRMAEYTGRCFDRAMSEMGPTQLNIPRDYFYGEITCEIPQPMRVEAVLEAGGRTYPWAWSSDDEALATQIATSLTRALVGGAVGIIFGLVLGTIAGLGIFWVANQHLRVFDWHYLFGYATLLLLAVHLALFALVARFATLVGHLGIYLNGGFAGIGQAHR